MYPAGKKLRMCVALSQIFSPDKKPSVVSVALLSLWLTVCVEGSKSPQYATEIFEKILRKNKILSRPQEPKQRKEPKRRKVLNLKAFKCVYDGSGCTNPHLGGAGFAVFREGKEICGGFETIPLGVQQYW